MSQTEEILDEIEDMIEETNGNGTENGDGQDGEDSEEITYEQALAWKQELQKARKKIAAMSKESKGKKLEKASEASNGESQPGESRKSESKAQTLSEQDIESYLESREFYKSNPEAAGLKDKIEKLYRNSDGAFTREEIMKKLNGDAEVEENRKVYSGSAVPGKQSQGESFTLLSVDSYDRLSPAQQKAYIASSKERHGGVKFKG